MNSEPQDIAGLVGARIRRIRQWRHISQAELARRAGIKAGPMNCIEKGKNVPSGRVLYSLSKALEVPIDAFFRDMSDVSDPDRQSSPDFIAEATVGGPVAEAASTRSSLEDSVLPARTADMFRRLMDSYLALEDICGAYKRSLLALEFPFSNEQGGVLGLTQYVRQALGIGQAVVFDYLELLENAGLRIIFCDCGSGIESWSYYDTANRNVFFFIDTGVNPEKQLFRLLYELGRIYVHTRHWGAAGVPGYTADAEFQRLDKDARQFAALFLMPQMAVSATVNQLGIGKAGWTYDLLLRIKHRFGVSAESFNIRLLELDLITRELAEDFRQRIHKHYAETDYGEPDSSRRILSPNGRLGDLLLTAAGRDDREEYSRIADVVKQHGIKV